MNSLQNFNQRLTRVRQRRKLTVEDVAQYCDISPDEVVAWESVHSDARAFPTLDQLLLLVLKSGEPLESFLDLSPEQDHGQLELPGFSVPKGEADLIGTLSELTDHIEKALPDARERELLRRYRLADQDKRDLILQLLPAS